MLQEYYVVQLNGERRYFSDIRKANEFAQDQADITKNTVIRYDINGGQSWFKPR
jgi:hypothetical protein